MPAKKKYYTVNEVAEMLKVTPQSVRNWYRSGSLKVMRVGRVIRISSTDLDKFVQVRGGNKTKTAEDTDE